MAARTWLHAFTDGRDVSPTSAARDLAELPVAQIATVCGRYYAMDRDSRWERTDRALHAICQGDGARGRRARVGSPGELRTRDHGRVHRADRPPRTSEVATGRQCDLLQLPPGPDEAAVTAPARSEDRPDDDDSLSGGLPVPGRVRRADRDEHARGRALGERSAAAARRRDREVRTRDVLLQRWRRVRARGRDPDPRPLAERRRELRPEARDVGSRGHRSTLRRARPRLPVRSRELREPRHGRSHRLDSGRGERCRDGRSLPRDGGRRVFRLPAACAS